MATKRKAASKRELIEPNKGVTFDARPAARLGRPWASANLSLLIKAQSESHRPEKSG